MDRHSQRLATLAVALAAVVMPFCARAAEAQHAPATPQPPPCLARLAGAYAVREMEMGGGILLRPDGSFAYQLAYGALDEEARGQWTCDEIAVYLTSEPVEPPRFVTLEVGPAPRGELHVRLDLPQGMSPQYFSAVIRMANGSARHLDFGEDGLTTRFNPGVRPISILPLLPVYAISGDPILLPIEEGIDITLRFLPNDLGKVAFEQMPMKVDGKDLSFWRFDQEIRFEQVGKPPEP